MKCINMTSNIELTFAGLHAVRPSVINFVVAKSSAILEPSAARSATSAQARFLDGTTFGTRGYSGITWRGG